MPEVLAQVLQQVRVGDLAAAALAEDAADQAGDGDDVLHAPVLRDGLVAGRRIVGGQRGGIGVRLRDVGVHAGDVVLDHLLGELALLAVLLRQPVDLRDRARLRVRGEQQLVVVHLLELAGRAEERREGALAVVPQHVHEEQPVLGLRVPGAEGEGLVGVAVDVRHIVLVAVDRDAGFRCLGAGDVGRFDAERLVVVVLAELRVGQVRVAVEQLLVLAELVLAVRRAGAVGLELQRVGRIDQAVLTGRQDAHRASVGVVVGAVGVRRRAGCPLGRAPALFGAAFAGPRCRRDGQPGRGDEC